MDGLDKFALAATFVAALTVVVGVVIQPMSQRRREQRMLAAGEAVRGYPEPCPEALRQEYEHQRVEYELALNGDPDPNGRRRNLTYIMIFTPLAVLFYGLLALFGSPPGAETIWWYPWFVVTWCVLPFHGVTARRWAYRRTQCVAYSEAGGPFLEDTLTLITRRQQTVGALEAITLAVSIALVVIAAVQTANYLFAAALLVSVAMPAILTYSADRGEAVHTLIFGPSEVYETYLP